MGGIFRSLLTEYGLGWTVNRLLYSIKIKMLSLIPGSEVLFEKKAQVKRVDLFDIDIKSIKDFLERLSGEKKEEIILIAEKAINGIFWGFSSMELDYGKPVNWHYNPLTKVEAEKSIKWYKIPDFDARVGDIKVIWEASRFSHFFYFCRAYLLTNDKKYYYAFSEQLKQWLENNPYPYGSNYKCGQECALRMVTTLMTYSVFKEIGLVSPEDKKNVMKLTEVCFKKIRSNFFYAHKCIRNNHTFSEICGLIVGSWCCMDDEGVRKAFLLFENEIKKQFLPDGGFTQYSFNYQRFTLQLIECVLKIGEKVCYEISETERIKNSVYLMYQMQNDKGDLANYGSNDGSLIFPVTSCEYQDFRPVLNTVYALIEDKRLYEPGDYDEELLWFGRKNHLPLVKIERKSLAFNGSGFYTLRHNGSFLITLLQDFKSRPAHMDQLHIDLWHKDINLFCDTGTYSYASGLGKELSSTSGHNTVKLAGVEQMNKRGAFFVYNWTRRKNVWHSKDSFTGTMVSKNGYWHKRTINKTKEGYKILDEVSGNGEFCEFYFHTPCDVNKVPYGFELFYEGAVICTVMVEQGDVMIKKALRSLYYLTMESINCVSVRCNMINGKCSVKFEINLK